jgi:hypothetical protein
MKKLVCALFAMCALGLQAQNFDAPNLRSISVEVVYTTGGTQNFVHNLNTVNPQYSCFSRSGASVTAVHQVDVNTVAVTVPAAADVLCSFTFVGPLLPTFSFSVGLPGLYVPTLAPTQSLPLTITQTPLLSFSSSVTYSSTGLPTGITTAYSPNPITGGTGTSALTLSFPYNQASGLNTFTVNALGGGMAKTAPVALPIATTNDGLVDGWGLSEGTGTTSANTTADSNTLTHTGVTWAPATGFPASTANYNGTTSVSVAANATNTAFNGSTPFSVCLWLRPTTVAPSDQFVVSNFDNALSTVTGWGIEVSAASMRVYLVNTLPSNYITTITGGGPMAVNVTHFFCMTYDGSHTAGGLVLYIDGTVAPQVIFNNSFTADGGSMAVTNPVLIGAQRSGTGITSLYSGALCCVRIHNRVLSGSEITTLNALGAK